MTKPAMTPKYVARHALTGSVSLMRFFSIGEVKEWIEFHNMVLGRPEAGTAYFCIEHVDGKPLSKVEHASIAVIASLSNYAARQLEVAPVAHGPGIGRAHALIARKRLEVEERRRRLYELFGLPIQGEGQSGSWTA